MAGDRPVHTVFTGDDAEEVSLFQFMETVASAIPDKWKRVGLALGLSQEHISGIDAENEGDPLKCFTEIFNLWQQVSTPQQPVSWTTLVSVLRSQHVDEELLANCIEETFIGNEYCLCSSDPVIVGTFLCSQQNS